MKKLFIFMVLIFISIGLFAQVSVEYNGSVLCVLSEPDTNQSKDCVYEDSIAKFEFYPKEYFVGVEVTNNMNERIYIEWENARLNGGKVVFDDDSRLLMNEKKEDEVVISNEKSVKRSITSSYKILSNTILPLYYKKDMKKDWKKTGKGYSTTSIIIPIKYGNKIIDYKFKLKFYYNGKK